MVLDPDEGKEIATTLADAKAAILQNHGLLTVGQSVGEAAWWFILMDKCCQIQLLAEAAGGMRLVGAARARGVAEMMGTPSMGRFNFRPLYAEIVAAYPDLLR